MLRTVPVTGGAGYIGSHALVELIESGYQCVVVDNLSNSSRISLDCVERITGVAPLFYEADIRDRNSLDAIFDKHEIDAVIHFAGLEAAGESVEKPVEYYQNNITGTLTLVESMREHGVKSIIFSSSATVYGDPAFVSITEDCPKGHVRALDWMDGKTGCEIFNLGTGTGYSVLDMLHAFENAVGRSIPYQIKPRRAGDIAVCYFDPSKAEHAPGWTAELDQDDMCADSWRWQSNIPEGYAEHPRGGVC